MAMLVIFTVLLAAAHAVTALVTAGPVLNHNHPRRALVDGLGVLRDVILLDRLVVEQLVVIEQRLSVVPDSSRVSRS